MFSSLATKTVLKSVAPLRSSRFVYLNLRCFAVKYYTLCLIPLIESSLLIMNGLNTMKLPR